MITPVTRARAIWIGRISVVIVIIAISDQVSRADPTSRNSGLFWSAGWAYQEGPNSAAFNGVRFRRDGYDDVTDTAIGLFYGGEVLAADQGRLIRAIGGLSPLVFPMGHRFSAWVYPLVGIDYLWGQDDGGLGASLGLGGELVFKFKQEYQLTFNIDRYYSTVLGTRNQVALAYRWGIKR